MNTQVLEDIGLSNVEIKVFLTILENGESKAGKIIEKSKLQSSSFYNALNSLISKGLISYIKKSEIKYYRAADPEVILDYLDIKKKEYLKLLPELKEKQKKDSYDGVEFFKSFKGIRTLMIELLKDSKKGDIYRVFGIEDSQKYELARERIFKSTKLITTERKIIMKGIFSEKTRYAPNKSSKMQKRYLTSPLPPHTLILNNKVAIISWEEEPSGILIHSKEMANKYSDFFEHLWKIAKP